MSVRLAGLAAASIAVLAGSITLPNLSAQDKPKARQNVQGTVVDISKDKSVITIRSGTATRLVGYDSNTKFLYGHSQEAKPGSVSQVKENFYISCAASFNAKKDLTATECVYRETK
jgi:hypothetical protein